MQQLQKETRHFITEGNLLLNTHKQLHKHIHANFIQEICKLYRIVIDGI